MRHTDYGILFGLSILFIAFCLCEIRDFSEKNVSVEESKPSISVEVNPLNSFELTFYTHTGYRTASGIYPKAGRTVAVDKKVIPLGSIIYVEGFGILIAEDTGADIKGNRLDIFVDTKEEALKLGRKKANVYILKTEVDGIGENLYNTERNLIGKGEEDATKRNLKK